MQVLRNNLKTATSSKFFSHWSSIKENQHRSFFSVMPHWKDYSQDANNKFS